MLARGGTQPGNAAEAAIRRGEHLYNERMLCGHVEEAARAFAGLWNRGKKTRRRLRKVIVTVPGGRDALDLLVSEISGQYRKLAREKLVRFS